jgi:hypothetical protein
MQENFMKAQDLKIIYSSLFFMMILSFEIMFIIMFYVVMIILTVMSLGVYAVIKQNILHKITTSFLQPL